MPPCFRSSSIFPSMFYGVLSQTSPNHIYCIFDVDDRSVILLSANAFCELDRAIYLLLRAEFCVMLFLKRIRLISFIFLNAFLLAHFFGCSLNKHSLCYLAYHNSMVEFFEHRSHNIHPARSKLLLQTLIMSHPPRQLFWVSYT